MLLKRNRQQYHSQVAALLETKFADMVEAHPELVARHHTEARNAKVDTDYWLRAGQKMVLRSTNEEAISHFYKGLETLATLPDSEARARQELALKTSLGPALVVVKGYASNDVAATYSRARELCDQSDDADEIFPVLWGLWLFQFASGNHVPGSELAKHLIDLATEKEDPTMLMQASLAMGASLFYLGEFEESLRHLDNAVALDDPEKHGDIAFRYAGLDSRVTGSAYCTFDLWLLGRVVEAVRRSDEMLALSTVTSHPYSQISALCWDSQIRQFIGDSEAVLDRADAALAQAGEQGFALVLAQTPIM